MSVWPNILFFLMTVVISHAQANPHSNAAESGQTAASTNIPLCDQILAEYNAGRQIDFLSPMQCLDAAGRLYNGTTYSLIYSYSPYFRPVIIARRIGALRQQIEDLEFELNSVKAKIRMNQCAGVWAADSGTSPLRKIASTTTTTPSFDFAAPDEMEVSQLRYIEKLKLTLRSAEEQLRRQCQEYANMWQDMKTLGIAPQEKFTQSTCLQLPSPDLQEYCLKQLKRR